MVYLFIILLVAIAFLILERQRFLGDRESSPNSRGSFLNNGIWGGNFFKQKENKENTSNLIKCDKCGIYTPEQNTAKKDGKTYCNECERLEK